MSERWEGGSAKVANAVLAFAFRPGSTLVARSDDPLHLRGNTRRSSSKCVPVLESFNDCGGRGCHKSVPVLGGNGTKINLPGDKEVNSGQACRSYRVSCSLIPGRSCFGDLPRDGIVVSSPPPKR